MIIKDLFFIPSKKSARHFLFHHSQDVHKIYTKFFQKDRILKINLEFYFDLSRRIMEISYVYIKPRHRFGKRCYFSEHDKLEVDIKSDPSLGQDYVRIDPIDKATQYSKVFATHEVSMRMIFQVNICLIENVFDRSTQSPLLLKVAVCSIRRVGGPRISTGSIPSRLRDTAGKSKKMNHTYMRCISCCRQEVHLTI